MSTLIVNEINIQLKWNNVIGYDKYTENIKTEKQILIWSKLINKKRNSIS